MNFYIRKGKNGKHPSLYDAFCLGDRVKRVYRDGNGNSREYRGIVLAIGEDSIEVYWDTLNGEYRPKDMEVAFTTCPVNEIFKGNDHYTPIEKEK